MNYSALCGVYARKKASRLARSSHRKTAEQKLFEEVATIREKQQEYDAHLTVMGTQNSYSKTDPDAIYAHERRPHEKRTAEAGQSSTSRSLNILSD